MPDEVRVLTQQEQDNKIVVQATQCFLSNPLGCVAYSAYGVLLLQLLQQHSQWPAVQKSMVPAPEDLSTARPCLMYLNRVRPLMDLNPLNAQGMHSMVDGLMDGLVHWTYNHGLSKIIVGSVRVTYNADNMAGIEFIVLGSNQPPAKGQ